MTNEILDTPRWAEIASKERLDLLADQLYSLRCELQELRQEVETLDANVVSVTGVVFWVAATGLALAFSVAVNVIL